MIDNNVQYLILTYISPATMTLVWNVKIVITAVLYRMVLKRKLSKLKWAAVILLFAGVMTTQSAKVKELHLGAKQSSPLAIGLGLCIVGAFTTSLAGVYSEWTLKTRTQQPFLLQNAQLYAVRAQRERERRSLCLVACREQPPHGNL